jgi:4-amino-4-deoxy-L-arabinose transferase-like glycosyltransferase
VSVAAGVGTVAATCAAGARAFGRRQGLWAAGIMALTTPFLYYAKTANPDVPYLFWFAV